jgi:hypothetical protein
MFVFKNGYTFGQSVVQIQTKKAMNYAGGSLKISGDVFDGVNVWNDTDRVWSIVVKIGIGLTRETAKWYYIGGTQSTRTIVHRWQSDPAVLCCPVQDKFKTVGGLLLEEGWLPYLVYFESVPCDDYGLYGYIFVDFLGMNHDSRPFEVGNFKITYSRDEIFIPTSIDQPKPRVMSEDRVSSFDYSATNSNGTGEDWNADCIYASDNDLDWGYGVIMDDDGKGLETITYDDTATHPEQHLANRVAAYGETSKRRISVELRTDVIDEITPQNTVQLDDTTCYPIAIGHDWHDDITTVKLLQI